MQRPRGRKGSTRITILWPLSADVRSSSSLEKGRSARGGREWSSGGEWLRVFLMGIASAQRTGL